MSELNEDNDALATMASEPEYQVLMAETDLERVSDTDNRVLTLIFRCLQSMRKLPYAVHPLQIKYANVILAAEVVYSALHYYCDI